jgi:hypothetical protein
MIEMSSPLELFKQLQRARFYDEDEELIELEMMPSISGAELEKLQSRIPAPIPPDVMELLEYSKGFDGLLEKLDLTGKFYFEMADLFPWGLPIAHDGYGNYWVIDFTPQSTVWGPIFFCCHDAPVIVYQAHSLTEFLEDLLEFGTDMENSKLDKVHEDYHFKIWRENPNILTYQECINSTDPALSKFAALLNPGYFIIDLRNPKVGDGFSWGRFGPKTVLKRFGAERIFAYGKKE